MKRTVLAVVIALFSTNCGKKELDRETALRLAQQRGGATTCPIAGQLPNVGYFRTAFRELVSAGVLVCQPMLIGQTCQLRNGGDVLTTGKMVPTGVSGITQTGPASAQAILQLVFQADPVYQQHRQAIDTICGGDQASKWSTQLTASFQHYDDGWRIEGGGFTGSPLQPQVSQVIPPSVPPPPAILPIDSEKAKNFERLSVELDPSISLEDQIRRGNYSTVDGNFTSRDFHLSLSGKREIILYEIDEMIPGPNELIRRMQADGNAPATLDDALAIGYKFPANQLQHPIAFLGGVWVNWSHLSVFPALESVPRPGSYITDPQAPALSLKSLDECCMPNWRFAAVHVAPTVKLQEHGHD